MRLDNKENYETNQTTHCSNKNNLALNGNNNTMTKDDNTIVTSFHLPNFLVDVSIIQKPRNFFKICLMYINF